MKTAIQDLIDWVDDYVKAYGMIPTEWDVKQKAKHLLRKEKDQMNACFQNGYIEGISQQSGLERKYKDFNDYYTRIFNNGTEGI